MSDLQVPGAAEMRSLLVTAGSVHRQPWWWNDIDHDPRRCTLEHETLIVDNGRLGALVSLESAALFWQVARILFAGRRRYAYVYTFECGWVSFAIAFLQTLSLVRRPKHVILQFIMREKQAKWQSRLKYAFMRWCFSSVHLCICSSRAECDYYASAFRWPATKLAFVPFHSDPRFLDATTSEGDYVIAAGRTLRDYATLTRAFHGLDTPLVVVAGRSSPGLDDLASNTTVRYDVPGAELADLMARSLAVAVPLEERQISTGQSVVLQAMALGKAVIATCVNGTEDYIEHMQTGILVPPRDPEAFRDAVRLVASDAALRTKLGRAARERVVGRHLPRHYARLLADVLRHHRQGEAHRAASSGAQS
jgi:glycosyltransferase involved in cell wall biosynthesis